MEAVRGLLEALFPLKAKLRELTQLSGDTKLLYVFSLLNLFPWKLIANCELRFVVFAYSFTVSFVWTDTSKSACIALNW